MSLFFNNFFPLSSFSVFISIYGESATISTLFSLKKLFILYMNLEKKLDLTVSTVVISSVIVAGAFVSRLYACMTSY